MTPKSKRGLASSDPGDLLIFTGTTGEGKVMRVHFGADLFLLLFPFQLSLFLGAKQGLFLLFPFAFIFTSLITHICFSVIENECSSQPHQTGLTSSAHGPFEPCPSLYDTRCPFWSSS